MAKKNGPKVLILDCELKPLEGLMWSPWDPQVGYNQITKDFSIISWAAKWRGQRRVFYKDQRNSKDLMNDKSILKDLRDLMDAADIIVGQNVVKFDKKKIFARLIINKIKQPSSFKMSDTLKIAKKHFGFTFNSLEALCDYLGVKHKKEKSKKYPGMDLWKECMNGNVDAWNEMKKYNIRDIIATEECWEELIPWDPAINFSLYVDEEENVCSCGSTEFHRNGFFYSSVGKFQRFSCANPKCRREVRSRKNMLSKDKRDSLRIGTNR